VEGQLGEVMMRIYAVREIRCRCERQLQDEAR
jgi:hypothetical protein